MYADFLKEKKKELGWTTEELAGRSGVPIGTINKILNGEPRSLRYDTMNALNDAFSREERKEQFVRGVMHYSTGMNDRLYTVEDYGSFSEEAREELIDGNVFYLAAPSTSHQMAVTRMVAQSMVYEKISGSRRKRVLDR